MTQLAAHGGITHCLGPQNGSNSDSSAIEETRRIREWLLGILRFAVTREECDRTALMFLAVEMDRLGASRTKSGFSYFNRTCTKLCDCVAARHDAGKLTELSLHIKKIEDAPLCQALRGALFAKRNKPMRPRQLDREYVWKGPSGEIVSHEPMSSDPNRLFDGRGVTAPPDSKPLRRWPIRRLF
jgi:hypothetical protein